MSDTPLYRLREAMKAVGLDTTAIIPGATLRYLTGFDFHLSERLTMLLVPQEDRPVAVLPNFEESNWRGNVDFDADLHLWDDTEGPAAAMKSAIAALPPVQTCGIESGVMRVFEIRQLESNLPDAKFVDAESAVLALRASKRPHEIAAMRKAIQIAESALEELVRNVTVGSVEHDLAARLSALLLEGGGEGISFGPIVLSGPNSALPHGVPGDRAIEPGDYLLIDFGTSYEGYHCDITRTFVVGAEPGELARKIYEAVREGNARGCAACRPGATAHEIHHATQDHFTHPDFAGFTTHRTGHGLGLDVHEPPSIMDGNHDPLAPGNIFTVEPGLYREGFGGVRIEDDVLITAGGAEILTTFPRELRVL